jgi:hypothetical protein
VRETVENTINVADLAEAMSVVERIANVSNGD